MLSKTLKSAHVKNPRATGDKYIREIEHKIISKPSRGVTPEYNISTEFPDSKRFWDVEKNLIDITECAPSSNKYAWWKCEKGHSYPATPNSITVKFPRSGCPYCSGHRVLVGFNDLATTHPELAKRWDHEKNAYSVTQISAGSSHKAWWICDKGHSYDSTCAHQSGGRGCPYCAGKRVDGSNSFSAVYPEQASQWDYKKNTLTPDQVSRQSGKRAWWVCDRGHNWESTISGRKNYGCPSCAHIVSDGEEEVFEHTEFLLGNDGYLVKNSRSTIPPLELDIYIPDLKIAIEYNGNYWHSEAQGKDRHYHHKKWQKCKDQGIQLITIWEDQWRDNQDLVKNMLAHKLGVSRGPRVFARKTTVVKVDNRVAREFCDTYHIQGFAPGSTYLGLEDPDGNLVALSIWRKNKTDLYLDRYCTSVSVVGGMGKLLKAGKQFARENGLTQIITFADHDVSDGGLYEELGFTHDGELNPDYKYLVNGERKHKFGYRLKRFRSDPELLYEEGLTETQLAKLNGLHRIWDSGKTRYTMEV